MILVFQILKKRKKKSKKLLLKTVLNTDVYERYIHFFYIVHCINFYLKIFNNYEKFRVFMKVKTGDLTGHYLQKKITLQNSSIKSYYSASHNISSSIYYYNHYYDQHFLRNVTETHSTSQFHTHSQKKKKKKEKKCVSRLYGNGTTRQHNKNTSKENP